MPDSDDLAGRLRAVEWLVLDVDGVLTDGTIAVDDLGVETKHFHVRDGAGIALWRKAGRKVAILSGRSARCVEHRAAELGISPVIQGASSKIAPFRAFLKEHEVTADRVAFMGDDLADLPVLAEAGLAACPGDAVEEVRQVAHFVARERGGGARSASWSRRC